MQGLTSNGNVPTANERSSNYTDFSDVFALNDGTTRNDILGRAVQKGTVLDPGTTRFVAAGAVDPVTGFTNTSGSGVCTRPVRVHNLRIRQKHYDFQLHGFEPATFKPYRSERGQYPEPVPRAQFRTQYLQQQSGVV